MKSTKFTQTVASVFRSVRPAFLGLLFLVVLLSAVLSSATSVQAAGAASMSTPTASYGCTGIYHRVRSGETIYSIAARYGSTAYRIASCNGLRSYTVAVGQTLLVPVYRKGTGGWIESIDFARDVSQPAPAEVVGDSIP